MTASAPGAKKSGAMKSDSVESGSVESDSVESGSAVTDGLPSYPVDRKCPFRPPAEYGEMQAGQPLSRVRFKEQPLWLVTSYETARDVLRDPRFSTDPAREGFPTGSVAPRPAPDPAKRRARAFLTMDEPEHGRYRRMLIPAFSARRTEAFRPRVEAIVDELIDRMTGERADGAGVGTAGGEADLIEAFALPLPSRVICELLGIDYAGSGFFQEKSAVAMDPGREPQDRIRAAGEVQSFLADVIAAKHRSPGDDLLSRLIAEQVDTGQLDDEQLCATAMALLIAGYETTAHMLALAVVSLVQRPELLDRLRQDETAAAPVVEELLRLWTVPHLGLYRAAVEDVEVGGETVRAGEGVIVSIAAADHDPEVFADPHVLDPDRAPRPHLAFGHGAHRCLGEPLATLELEIALRRLAVRLPKLRLRVAVDELSFRDQHFIYGLNGLPVAW